MSPEPPDGRDFQLVTDRLALRAMCEADAEFILELLNEPSFVQYIGDRGVRSLADAQAYIRNGPRASYASFGFGLWLVSEAPGGTPIGMCGLLKRETLEDVDLGFAFRPAHWGRGFALEAARAVLAHGQAAFGLRRVVAVVQPDNAASLRVLGRLGFEFERMIEWPGTATPLMLLGRTLP